MFLISETLYSHAYNTEAPHQIIHQGIAPQWYFQQPPPGYGQQDPPGPLQHHQNSPQPMMPNSHATLTAAQHRPILMQQHGQATVITSLKKIIIFLLLRQPFSVSDDTQLPSKYCCLCQP